jgi:hypothetical protein
MIIPMVCALITWPDWLSLVQWAIAFILDKQGIPFPVACAIAKMVAFGIWNSIWQ